MKHQYLLLAAICALPLAAFSSTDVLAGADESDYTINVEQSAPDGPPEVFSSARLSMSPKAEADSAVITFKLVYDDSTKSKVGGTTAALSPGTLRLLNADGSIQFITMASLKKANYQVKWPKGTYDVFGRCAVNCQYRPELYEKYKGVSNLVYVKEGVKIDADTTIVIDFNEAIYHIHFAPVASNGKPFTFCTRTLGSDKSETFADDGTMVDGGMVAQLVASGHKSEVATNVVTTAVVPGISHLADGTESNAINYFDFLSTKCSSKIQFTNLRYGILNTDDANKPLELVLQTVTGCNGDTTVTNTVSSYVNHKEFFTPSVKGETSPIHYAKATCFIKQLPLVNLQATATGIDTLQAGDPVIANFSINDPTGYYTLRQWVSLGDYIPAKGTKYNIDGPVFLANDPQTHRYASFGPANHIYQCEVVGSKAVAVNRPVKGLTMPYNESNPLQVGNNAPTYIIACPSYVANAKTYLGFSVQRLGRYGEKVGSGTTTFHYGIYYNDALQASGVGFSNLSVSNRLFSNKHYNTGIVRYELNDSNARFDGLKAASRVVNVVNLSKTDLCAPSLIYVRMHDAKDNLVSDHINYPDAYDIEIIAADRNFQRVTPPHYDNKPVADIKVAYALHGTNDWTELPVSELADSADYVGHFYTAPMASIAKPTSDVLYDLKVTLKDEAGNSQEQTLSPAFVVLGKGSGVSDVATAQGSIVVENGSIVVKGQGAATTVSVFDACGRCVISGASSAQPISMAALAPGIYVVRSGAVSAKVVIK